MNFCYGPMTLNVVNTVIKFSLDHPENKITFIPSRRQIEYNGGYVNNWKTKDFVEYVKSQNDKIIIERDHGGPDQGIVNDDGFESLREDALLMDIIHIDPWKKSKDIDQGIRSTINMIEFCYNINPKLLYEIATEEAIRPFSVEELEYIIIQLKINLQSNIFNKIKFLVIQCGTKLLEGKNTGIFDENKLKKMLELAIKYNLTAKEHNGDWISLKTIEEKKKLGLQYINIAPELGEIESHVILKKIKSNTDDYNSFYEICLQSGKWKKWVSEDFDYKNKKDEIILICGHYNLTNPQFLEIKKKYVDIDEEIESNIYDRLLELYDIYQIRKKCIFCDNNDFELLFHDTKYKTTLSLGMYSEKQKSYFMPYNVQICKKCYSYQNKYIGNLSIIYNNNHIDNYGTTKNKKHILFGNFINENENIDGIVEVGSCNGILANHIMENNKTKYTIIEPSFTGDRTNINIIPDFLENIDIDRLNTNSIIMSDVFEHFYNPNDILNKIKKAENIKYIYLNHPDFDYSIKNNLLINLFCEHTFLIEHQFLFTLFENYGFKLKRRYDFDNHSLFLEFERIHNNDITNKTLINNCLYHDGKIYFDNILKIVNNINNFMNDNPNLKIYIWPSSVHSQTLFTLGLNYTKIEGILDNSPNKIGKYLYGYELLCSSFYDIMNIDDINNSIILSNGGSYTKELNITNNKTRIYFLDNFI
jgi:hypothetical protein